MGELLPCPHCGNDGSGPIEEALHIALNEHEWRGPTWTVQCDKCTATMGYFDSGDAAIEAWNTRTNLAADALIEAERRGAERMRERAAKEAEHLWDCLEAEASPFFIAAGIRALPLTEEPPMPTLDERIEAVRQGRGERDNPILLIIDLAAEREQLRALALKAFTVVEWVAGEGFMLEHPHEDADDLLLEMAKSLGVESSAEARAALASEPRA